jgi:tetratricopeptide (TPR) repeat protein
MSLARFLVSAAAAAALAWPAGAAITVIGDSSARICYEIAESKLKPNGTDIARCDTALEDEPISRQDMVATFVNRGILKFRMGRFEDAIADYDRALERDSEEPEAYLNKGMATLNWPELYEEALRLFDTAIQKGTRKPEIAYYGRAVANERLGRVKAAYDDYMEASRLAPDWEPPRAELTRFTVRGGVNS